MSSSPRATRVKLARLVHFTERVAGEAERLRAAGALSELDVRRVRELLEAISQQAGARLWREIADHFPGSELRQ